MFALDARTGKELWRWDPEVNQQAVRPKVCCGIVNRGLAIYNGMIFAPIIDGRLEALNALTGKVIWESRVAFPQDYYSITMAPRVANGKVMIGVSGGDHPIRGFFDAYDAETGRRAWRFYTVPGNPADGYENEAMRKAAKTWGGDFYKMGGGGSVWDGMAYDPEADLIYVGTGNAEPWVQKFRGAQNVDNLYTASILAVKVSTGELKWHYQAVPNDNWDYDNVQQMILADLTINGTSAQGADAGVEERHLLCAGSHHRRIHLRTGLHAGELDSRLRRIGSPHDQPGSLLRQRADHHFPDRGRRPQLGADVLQSGHRPGLHSHHLRKLDLRRRRQSDLRIPTATRVSRPVFLPNVPTRCPSSDQSLWTKNAACWKPGIP